MSYFHFPVVGYHYRQTNWGLFLEAKRERRRAERQWLKSGLEIAQADFPFRLQTRQQYRATSKIYILQHQDPCMHFIQAVVQHHKHTPSVFANITMDIFSLQSKTSSLPQRFCDFFENKISTIRDNLNSQTTPLPPATYAVFDGFPLTAFHPVSESSVRKMLNKTAIKTCEMDPLPSLLLAELIDDLLLSFASVINDSLLTGSFPSVFKFAVVR